MRRYDVDALDNRRTSWIAPVEKAVGPLIRSYFRARVHGLERIPDGAALYVGNHNGGMASPDSFVFVTTLIRERGIEHLPYFLAHDLPISLPGLHQAICLAGGVRASHRNAERLLRAGRKVFVYPGGDLDAMRAHRDRHRIIFGPRRGYIRLALRNGVPVIPVVAAGAHQGFFIIDDGRWLARLLRLNRFRLEVWPIVLSIPWGLTVGPPPGYLPWRTRIHIEVMEPVHFERSGPAAADDADYVEECHRLVHGSMLETMQRLTEERARAGGRP